MRKEGAAAEQGKFLYTMEQFWGRGPYAGSRGFLAAPESDPAASGLFLKSSW
jgi:hypothetical protein